ncbi:glycosyl transferase [Mucilaginibacter sp. JRF]|uniref:beta-1,6-N-acetylglucosaminyltransferase n=1 Tax=Mucilaginibacter sp. JRF TaxID=2780088 RepID=UPI0018819820|nr:beta-1,6-N-acetylglucosaminyltransferase [Mucilaginibacter sp. JRF]MBE9586353.1 glycosyl transferase [Mucilaginibacter sp. JRF]
MKLAHLILAHQSPEQLSRLVSRISHPDADIFVHIDAKVSIEPFEQALNADNVIFITDRVRVYWGAFSIVHATINGLKQILDSDVEYSYINLLSGHDYPLQSADALVDFLKANLGKAFMNFRMAKPNWLEALPRVQKYHLDNYRFPLRYRLQYVINKILPERELPDSMVLVGRSQWFTMCDECVRYILEYWDSHSAFRRFIKLTWAPDEFVFQTILYNSPMNERMISNDLRFIDWSRGGINPRLFTIDDADMLKKSGMFFARKFDMAHDSAILNYIDDELLHVHS